MGPKLVIRAPNHLGDCIMALPMISETREVYPGATVSLLVPESLAQLFENNPAIDTILRIPTAHVHGLVSVMKIKDMLEPHAFDVGYILPPSFGAAASYKLAGVKERIGYIADGRRLLLTRPMPLPAPMNSQHRSITYFDLLRRATNTPLEYTPPKIFLTESDTTKAQEILSAVGVPAGSAYAVIAFQSVAESRRWGIGKYTELSRRLVRNHGLYVVLVGGVADQRAGDGIVQEVDSHIVNIAGKTSLRESAAIISQAAFFVGNDSGPAHLAAATGTPLVVLSGADDPKETSPIARRKQLIYLSHLPCISCVKNVCPIKGESHMRCMDDISVSMVLEGIKLLQSEQAA